MAVGQAAPDPERLGGRHQALTPQAPLDRVDDRVGQGGQTGEGPVLDRAALPVRLAQQDRDVLPALVDPAHSGHVQPVSGSESRAASPAPSPAVAWPAEPSPAVA